MSDYDNFSYGSCESYSDDGYSADSPPFYCPPSPPPACNNFNGDDNGQRHYGASGCILNLTPPVQIQIFESTLPPSDFPTNHHDGDADASFSPHDSRENCSRDDNSHEDNPRDDGSLDEIQVDFNEFENEKYSSYDEDESSPPPAKVNILQICDRPSPTKQINTHDDAPIPSDNTAAPKNSSPGVEILPSTIQSHVSRLTKKF